MQGRLGVLEAAGPESGSEPLAYHDETKANFQSKTDDNFDTEKQAIWPPPRIHVFGLKTAFLFLKDLVVLSSEPS